MKTERVFPTSAPCVCTFIGLLIFGRFHRLHNTDDTDNMVKNASTKLEYVMSILTSLVKSMSRDRIF